MFNVFTIHVLTGGNLVDCTKSKHTIILEKTKQKNTWLSIKHWQNIKVAKTYSGPGLLTIILYKLWRRRTTAMSAHSQGLNRLQNVCSRHWHGRSEDGFLADLEHTQLPVRHWRKDPHHKSPAQWQQQYTIKTEVTKLTQHTGNMVKLPETSATFPSRFVLGGELCIKALSVSRGAALLCTGLNDLA